MSQYSPVLPWSPYETMKILPAQWNLGTPQLEPQLVNYYNNILEQQIQRDSEFSASAENESSRESSSTSFGSHSPPVSLPRHLPSRDRANNKGAKSSKERRREQNRISQRAFRDRKDVRLKTLQSEITQWQAKHQELYETFSSQSTELRKLKATIEELRSKTAALQAVLSAQIPMEFDLVPVFDWDSTGDT